MNNYRVTFYHDTHGIDYWKDFGKARKYFPIVKAVFDILANHGVKLYWFFYEPFIEITWINDDEAAARVIQTELEAMFVDLNITDAKFTTPANGQFADWYCNTPAEMEFGAKRHALCAQWVMLYHEYQTAVDGGKGLEQQVARTIHTLSNPLALNYKAEARICLRRGLACFLYSHFPEWVSKRLIKFLL